MTRMTFRRPQAPAAFVAAWLLLGALSELVVPNVILRAYRGESAPVFNRVIRGQNEHSPEHYVERWRSISRPPLIVIGAAGLLLGALLVPAVQERLVAALESFDGARNARAEPVLPTRGRRRLIHAGIFLLVAGTLTEMVLDPRYSREHWPFSQYQMYSELQTKPAIAVIRLFGVTADPSAPEIPLVEAKYIEPFDHSRLWFSLSRIESEKDRDRMLSEALGDCLRRYDVLRRAGRHDGARLVGLRLYRLKGRLDPWARNPGSPTDRTLLYEVLRFHPSTPSS